jgi:dnd system-associated protein 4
MYNDATKKNDIEWRNINVFRNRKYHALVERLCVRKSQYSNRPIFDFNKDLMVFAAMVGHKNNKKEKVEKEPVQITLGTYSSDEKDGYIYLLALLEYQEAEILKDDNISKAVKLFEAYCNGGLSIIQAWMDDNPSDIEGVDTLINNIFETLLSETLESSIAVSLVETQPKF